MKRTLEHSKEEIYINKKIKYDDQQDVSINEASPLTDDEKNFKEKKSLSDTDENVSESSSEGIEYNTDLNLSPSSETQKASELTGKGSTKLSLNNLEITKNGDGVKEIENNSKVIENFLGKITSDYILNLKKGVEDEATMDHIIASILEIYTQKLRIVFLNVSKLFMQLKENNVDGSYSKILSQMDLIGLTEYFGDTI